MCSSSERHYPKLRIVLSNCTCHHLASAILKHHIHMHRRGRREDQEVPHQLWPARTGWLSKGLLGPQEVEAAVCEKDSIVYAHVRIYLKCMSYTRPHAVKNFLPAGVHPTSVHITFCHDMQHIVLSNPSLHNSLNRSEICCQLAVIEHGYMDSIEHMWLYKSVMYVASKLFMSHTYMRHTIVRLQCLSHWLRHFFWD